MSEREAHAKKLHFVGPCLNSYPSKDDVRRWEEVKTLARKIKKEYQGVEYTILYGDSNSWLGSGNRGLYGNERFSTIFHELRYGSTQSRLSNYERKKKELEEEYNAKLAEIDSSYQKDLDLLKEIDSWKKTN